MTHLQIDRHEDMLRSCLRAVAALQQLPGVEGCAPLTAFMRRILAVPALKEKYAAVEQERVEQQQGSGAMDIP